MKASGSGRTPGNFSSAASTSRRCGIAVRVFARGERLGLLPPLAAGEIRDKAGTACRARATSETPSVSTSRSVRPPIGKSGGAPSAAMTASTRARIVGRENAERVADHVVEAGVGEIELDMPGFFLRAGLVEACARQESAGRRIVARAACARCCRRAAATLRGAGAGDGRLAAAPRTSVLSMRAVSLPPGTHRFSRSSFFVDDARWSSPRSCSRTGRNPAAPSPPSCAAAAACLRRASCARRIGMVWSCHGASPSSASPSGRCARRRHQRGALLGRERGDARAVERDEAGEEAVQPGALLGARTARSPAPAIGIGGGTVWRHSAASASNIALSASISWRRVKARKVSSRPARLREIALQHALDGARRVLGLHVAVEFAPDARRPARSRRRQGCDSPRPCRHLRRPSTSRADQADVADVMLRAGMVAAGEMDVDRRVERDARARTMRRSRRRAPWYARRRSGSRSRRCRRRARRGSRVACVVEARALRSRPRPARPCRPARRRSAGSARP